MKFVTLLIVSLSVPLVALGDSICSTDENGRQSVVRSHRRNAADLKAFHQQQRIRHKDYVPNYPPDYLATIIYLGQSRDIFFVSLDTGVDTVWVLDANYPNLSNDTQAFNASDPKSTAIDSGRLFNSVTGDSGVYGEKYYDIIEYFFPINQSFGAVETVAGSWYDPGFDDVISGSFGLSYNPDLKNERLTPDSAPVLNMFSIDPEMERYYVMAVGEWLNNGSAFVTGCVTFGAFPDRLCQTKPIATTSLYYDYNYNSLSFKLESFYFGGKRIAGDVAKIDTGLPTILVPLEAFNLVFNVIQPDYDFDLQLYTTDCLNAGVFDDFVFTFGGDDLAIPSTIYVIDLGLSDGRCVVKFSLSNDFTTPFALGLPFTDAFCVKWDIDNNKISMFNFLD